MKKTIVAGALVASLIVVGCNNDSATPTPATEAPAEAIESVAAEEVEAVESIVAEASEAVEAVESIVAEASPAS